MKMPNNRGDQSKRTCKFYACCPELKEVYEDETGYQLFCEVCGVSQWIENEDENENLPL